MSFLKTSFVIIALVTVAGRTLEAGPIVTFYTDRASFNAALSSRTDIDFEGIVNDGNFVQTPGARSVDGVTFGVPSGSIGVAGKNSGVIGSPFDSAILFGDTSQASGPSVLTADLTTLSAPVTAVGGFFGDTNGPGTAMTLTLTGSSGVLDTRNLIAADMGSGTPSNFFGWTVRGETIVSVTHSLNDRFLAGIDDFSFGTAAVPTPGSLVLLGMGLGTLGLTGVRRRNKSKAAANS